MLITDHKLKEALAILTDHDGSYSKTRAGHDFSKANEKTVLAKLMLQSPEKSVAAKKTWAEAHADYSAALEQTRTLAEMDYNKRAQRDAAQAIVDTWRTEQSNERAHTRIPQRRQQ